VERLEEGKGLAGRLADEAFCISVDVSLRTPLTKGTYQQGIANMADDGLGKLH
jgi:hypothetical protein